MKQSLPFLPSRRAVASLLQMAALADCKLKPGEKVDKRWVVIRKLGEGNFGAVYEAKDAVKEYGGTMALKLESRRAEEQVLKIEVAVLESVKRNGTTRHMCLIYECGRNNKFNYILMSLLGPSLSVLRKHAPEQRFTMSTSIRLLLQCLESLRDMHHAGWIHRDIKPSNFAMGSEPSKKLRDTGGRKKSMRKARGDVGFRGTTKYCSLNAHLGVEIGRQDDLISTLYAFLEMTTGKLKWSNIDDEEEVKVCKQKAAATLYCGMPDQLNAVHSYLHSLKYEDEPCYQMCEDIFYDSIISRSYQFQPFDWEKWKTVDRFWNTAQLPHNKSESSDS